MGPVVPFIPMIASAVGGLIGGKKATQAAQTRSPEEQTALTSAQGASSALTAQGGSQFNTGTGLINSGASQVGQAGSYFSNLLSGNRALQSQAIAAPRAAIQDTYAGAERGLERSGVRGAARDEAKVDLAKNQAGAISSLITGVQPGAATALANTGATTAGIGTTATGQGISATGTAGSISSNLLGQGANNRYYARDQGQQFGQGFGGLIFDALKGFGKGGSKGNSMPGTALGPLTLPSVGGG